MRKVIASLFSSVDCVVEAPNEWQFGFDEQMGAALSRMFDEQDAMLLGRVTYTEWAAYWPTSIDEPFAGWINGIQKYVASTTLASVDEWQNTTLVKGPLTDFVRELREQPGGSIGTGGSPSVVRSLLAANLVDELILFVHPVVAGGGRKRLFLPGVPLTRLALVDATPTPTGVIIATYRPVVE